LNREEQRGSRLRVAEEVHMAGTVARVTEISAKSDSSFEDAVKVAVDRAGQTLRGITSAWVKEQEVEVSDGRISGYKVNLLVTFVLE
jgi:flavin-binding protein dodecin